MTAKAFVGCLSGGSPAVAILRRVSISPKGVWHGGRAHRGTGDIPDSERRSELRAAPVLAANSDFWAGRCSCS